jgi:IclR family transcriptional regulator, pca regulon regulatory protein
MKEVQDRYYSKFFEKGLKVLTLFSPDHESLNLKRIATAIESDTSSAYRFVNTLVKLSYLRKDPHTKLLTLGPKAYSLGLNLVKSFNLLRIIKPLIDEAYGAYQITIDSAILDSGLLLKVYQRIAKDTLSYQLPQVEKEIQCTALGKAILAYLPDSERDAIIDGIHFIKKTENAIMNKKNLLIDLEETRKRRYAVNREEYISGVLSIGAPFFDLESRRPVGAISFDFSVLQYSLEEGERKFGRALLELADKISRVVPFF